MIIIIWAVSVRNAPLGTSVVLLACVSRAESVLQALQKNVLRMALDLAACLRFLHGPMSARTQHPSAVPANHCPRTS